MLPLHLSQEHRIRPPSLESGYESQPIDNMFEPCQRPEVAQEMFWSDCPLARYYISKEDEMGPITPSHLPPETLEQQHEAMPDYLELRKWETCKAYQSDPRAIFWEQERSGQIPEYLATYSSAGSHHGSSVQLSTSTHLTESSEESGQGTDEDDQYTEASTSNSSNEETGNAGKSNSKEISSVNLLQDLCKVCGDRSTGYHYKVMACEGCKGFFRRSVDRSSQYKCHRNNSCDIDKVTRNRCQACRFKKCLQMGMCKESVRRDRNHKRKLKPADEFSSYLPDMDESQMALVTEVLEIHRLTYIATDIRSDRWSNPTNASNNLESILWEEESDLSMAGIFRAIQFSKKVPGFSSLSSEDQVTLLRHACIEIMVLRFCTRYFPELNGFYFPSGKSLSRKAVQEHFGPLANLMIDMSETLIKLSIDDTELALMQSICLLSSARPGLKYRQQIQHFEEQMSTALMVHVCKRRLTCPLALHEIVQKLFSLRLMGRIGSEIILAPQQTSPTETAWDQHV